MTGGVAGIQKGKPDKIMFDCNSRRQGTMNGSILENFAVWIDRVFHCQKKNSPGMWEHLDKEIERPTGVFLFPSIMYCTGRSLDIRTTLKVSQGNVCARMVSE